MTSSSRDFMGLLFILIIVGIIWSMSGRGLDLSGFSLKSGPRLSPSSSKEILSTPETLFESSKTTDTKNETQTQQTTTPTKEVIQINILSHTAQSTDPQKEYILIRNSGQTDVKLSGLKLRNKKNEDAEIRNDESGNPIILFSGEEAYILTGKTTKGINFKIHKCSGYFNQFHQFTPSISSNCPLISSLPEANNLDDQCFYYLPQIRYCQTPTSLPVDISGSCQQFIQDHASYVGCVKDYKNDRDFDKGEWRIFLNRTTEFWAQRNETIKLVDQTGKTIVEVRY